VIWSNADTADLPKPNKETPITDAPIKPASVGVQSGADERATQPEPEGNGVVHKQHFRKHNWMVMFWHDSNWARNMRASSSWRRFGNW
jgi:hypothetical protein